MILMNILHNEVLREKKRKTFVFLNIHNNTTQQQLVAIQLPLIDI